MNHGFRIERAFQHTGFPMNSKITSTTCCQAVKELRSTVTRPVPVAALTHMNNASTNLTGNFPLLPHKTRDPRRGVMMLPVKSNISTLGVVSCGVLTTREGAGGKSSD